MALKDYSTLQPDPPSPNPHDQLETEDSAIQFYNNFPELSCLDDYIPTRQQLASDIKSMEEERKQFDKEIIAALDYVERPAVMFGHLKVEKVSSKGQTSVDMQMLTQNLVQMGVDADVVATAVLMSTKPANPYSYVKITDTTAKQSEYRGGKRGQQ